MANVYLDPQERRDIIKAAATEVDHALARSNPAEYERQMQGVIDTILNRVASPEYPDTVAAVVNDPGQFSAINGPTGQGYRVWGSVANVPDSIVPAGFDTMVENYVDQRIMGTPSSVGGNLSYFNPRVSSPGWGSQMTGPVFGAGDRIHQHGTTLNNTPFEAVLAPGNPLPATAAASTRWLNGNFGQPTALAAIDAIAPTTPPIPRPSPSGSTMAYSPSMAGFEGLYLPEPTNPLPSQFNTIDPSALARYAAGNTAPGQSRMDPVGSGPGWTQYDDFLMQQMGVNAPIQAPAISSSSQQDPATFGGLSRWLTQPASTTPALPQVQSSSWIRPGNDPSNPMVPIGANGQPITSAGIGPLGPVQGPPMPLVASGTTSTSKFGGNLPPGIPGMSAPGAQSWAPGFSMGTEVYPNGSFGVPSVGMTPNFGIAPIPQMRPTGLGAPQIPMPIPRPGGMAPNFGVAPIPQTRPAGLGGFGTAPIPQMRPAGLGGFGTPPIPMPASMRPQASSGSGGGSSYTIQAGDTLSSIASRMGTTVQALAAANGISDPNRIQAGATLNFGSAPRSPSYVAPQSSGNDNGNIFQGGTSSIQSPSSSSSSSGGGTVLQGTNGYNYVSNGDGTYTNIGRA